MNEIDFSQINVCFSMRPTMCACRLSSSLDIFHGIKVNMYFFRLDSHSIQSRNLGYVFSARGIEMLFFVMFGHSTCLCRAGTRQTTTIDGGLAHFCTFLQWSDLLYCVVDSRTLSDIQSDVCSTNIQSNTHADTHIIATNKKLGACIHGGDE